MDKAANRRDFLLMMAGGTAMTSWGELRNYYGIPRKGPCSDKLARQLIHGYYGYMLFACAFSFCFSLCRRSCSLIFGMMFSNTDLISSRCSLGSTICIAN